MDQTDIAAQQDAMRPLRMFIGALSGAMIGADQSMAGQDGTSWNVPGQYQVLGPYSVSPEGRPIATTPGGGLYVSPMLVMLAIGAAAYALMKG